MINDNENIDILEELINEYDPEVMERLLWDHSRPTDNQLISKLNADGHHHIYWATDDYAKYGDGFGFYDELKVSCLIGDYRTLVRPRSAKSFREKNTRTKDKAEVFTPSWVCNIQNNLLDSEWFGEPNVFNKEIEKDGVHTWIPSCDKIVFPRGKSWQDYVRAKCLEIACGEAPYLVNRYDATSGLPNENLKMRIGLLDRKLRVVGENVATHKEWFYWALEALKSTYGFEWQGDNLLLAREAVLFTLIDYSDAYCHSHHSLSKVQLSQIADIIAWNIFQMNGLDTSLPQKDIEIPKHKMEFTGDLFSNIEQHSIAGEKIFAKIAEWSEGLDVKKKVIEFRTIYNHA